MVVNCNRLSLPAIGTLVLIVLLLLAASLAHAVTTTYNGVTINWEAGLSDLQPAADLPAVGNNLYYETKQLLPGGNSLPITITLPAAFAQQNGFPRLTLWSKAGGSSPYGIVKDVHANFTAPDYLPYDLVLAPDSPTYVNYASGGGTFQAFWFAVDAYPDPGNLLNNVTFYVHVSLDKSMRKDLDFLLAQLGSELDNIFTDFDKTSCSIGFPTHSVNTSTLNLLVQDTEFSVQSLGPRLASTRTWNSTPARGGMFGNGWSFPYESTLKKSCAGAEVTSGGGQTLLYKAGLCPDTPLVYPVSATAPTGNRNQLTYASGNYWMLEQADSHETLRYDLASGDLYRLTSITDKNGNQLAITYNGSGAIDRITDAAGRQLSFTYDANLRPITMLAPGNLQASFGYDARGNLIRTVDLYGTEILYQYDLDNYMTSMSYAGRTISYTYDSSGGWKHVATVTDAEGKLRRYEGYAGSAQMSYTDAGSKITDALGNVTTYTKDPEGRTTGVLSPGGYSSGRVYAGGLPVSERDQRGSTTLYAYDARGNLTKQTDPTGHWISYTYDGHDNQLTKSNDLGQTWTNAYDASGNLISVTSPLGKTTLMAYDSRGQVTRITDAKGQATLFTHDSFGHQKTSVDPLGGVTSFGYDSDGLNPVSMTDANGNTSQFAYDQNRRLTRLTHPDGAHRDFSYDACARTGSTDENAHSAGIVRDKMLRELTLTTPTHAVTSKTYDGNGNLVSVTDPLNHTQLFAYDPQNRLISQTNALGGTVSYTRDGNGNATGVQDERGNTTTFALDANNQVVSITDALNRSVSFTRDALGRVVSKRNGRGAAMDLSYNADGQLASRTFDASTATYQYDSAGNPVAFTDTGGTTAYSYDAANRVTAITYPDGKSVSFTYDSAGNLLTTAYPGGVTLSYTRSNRTWVQSMQWGANTVSFAYDPAGNLLTEVRSNGTSSAYLYDASNRTTRVQHQHGTATFASMQYTLDAVGNPVAETSILPTTAALANATNRGTYDSANQIQGFKGASYSYDLDGNVVSATGAAGFLGSYDQMNRLVSMTSGGVQSDYRYDAVGNRVQAKRGAATTNYYHDQNGRLLFEADGAGGVLNYFIYHGSRLVAMRSAAGASYFYHHDRNGNTLVMTDASGGIVNAYAYTPYGEIVGSTEGVANRFKYVGGFGVMDEGNGIYFMKHRYYDAASGRFLQRDPVGFAGGQSNLYAYAGGNPIERIDPSGTGWLDWIKKVLGFKEDVEALKVRQKAEAERAKTNFMSDIEQSLNDGSYYEKNDAFGGSKEVCKLVQTSTEILREGAENVAVSTVNTVSGGNLLSGIALSAAVDQLKGPR